MRFLTRHGASIVVLGTVGWLAHGQGSAFEEVVKEMLASMEKLTAVLETIKDEETAKAARPELRQAAGRWQELRKKADNLKPPSKEEKDRLEKEYKEKMQVALRKFLGHSKRVENVPGGKEALQDIAAILKNKEQRKP